MAAEGRNQALHVNLEGYQGPPQALGAAQSNQTARRMAPSVAAVATVEVPAVRIQVGRVRSQALRVEAQAGAWRAVWALVALAQGLQQPLVA